jgi:hypothetical protein
MARYASTCFGGSGKVFLLILLQQNLPEYQCIFVRGFRVVRILNIFPILRGQAGPAPDIDEHQPGPDKQCQLEPMGTCADADVNISAFSFFLSFF